VLLINGNHETMNYLGDWRYVSPGDLADFGSPDARKAAFSAQGELGAAILSRPVVAAVGDTIFCHGGVSEGMAGTGVEGLNAAAARALLAGEKAAVLGEAGPLWYRGYLLNDEAVACAELKRALDLLGANRMVVGHTTQESGQVAVRCGGSLLGIDTGISTHYGGHLAALELRKGDAWAMYPSGPVDLPDPLRTGSPGQP
jgi:hypothetical protein